MSYQIKDNKIYKLPNMSTLGEVKNNKIYKWPNMSTLGEVKNNKIYKYPAMSTIGDLSKIKREIKDSSRTSDAHLVAIYHFLIKPIF